MPVVRLILTIVLLSLSGAVLYVSVRDNQTTSKFATIPHENTQHQITGGGDTGGETVVETEPEVTNTNTGGEMVDSPKPQEPTGELPTINDIVLPPASEPAAIPPPVTKPKVESHPVTPKKETLVDTIQSAIEGLYTPGGTKDGSLSVAGVVYYTTLARQAEGIQPFSTDIELTRAAQLKLADMFENQYFAHDSPSGIGPSDWVDATAYEYVSVAENIAMGGFQDDEDLVNKWMESPGHRANILNPKLTDLGVAVGKGELDGDTVWLGVQMFGRPLDACPAIDEDLGFQIETLRATIEASEIELERAKAVIEKMSQPTSQAEYNSQVMIVDEYNDAVADYQALIREINQMVSKYNTSVDAFNTCVGQS